MTESLFRERFMLEKFMEFPCCAQNTLPDEKWSKRVEQKSSLNSIIAWIKLKCIRFHLNYLLKCFRFSSNQNFFISRKN